MKILYLTDFAPNMAGGVANVSPSRIAAQAKIDEVFWLAVNDYFEWQSNDYQFDFGTEWKNQRLDDIPFSPDIIVFDGLYSWLKHSNYPKDARRKSIPYVVLPHSLLNFKVRDMRFFFKVIGTPRQFETFVHYAKAIQFFTDEQKAESETFGAPTIIIPNGVAARDFTSREFKNGINALYIGRVAEQKGLDMFLDACANIKSTLINKNFTLDIYGTNTNLLTAQINNLELQDIIKLHNPIFGADKDKAFRAANAFILPSRYEGQSIALLEALSYSLPVLTTTAANMTQEISSAGAGFVAEPNVESLQQNLINLLNSFPTKFSDMSNAAYTLSKNYFWQKIAQDTHDIYSELIK